MTQARSLLLPMALLTLAACGPASPGGSSSADLAKAASVAPPAASPKDVCALIPAADVERITGVKVGLVTPRKAADFETGACEYQHADTAQFGTSIIAATAVIKPEKVSSQETMWTTMFKTEALPGTGDVARYNEMGSALFVRQGDKAVTVQVLDNKGGDAARRTIASQIAALLLAK